MTIKQSFEVGGLAANTRTRTLKLEQSHQALAAGSIDTSTGSHRNSCRNDSSFELFLESSYRSSIVQTSQPSCDVCSETHVLEAARQTILACVTFDDTVTVIKMCWQVSTGAPKT